MYTKHRGTRKYEGTNHLGNVLVVYSDKRLTVCDADTVSYYTADILVATDYSPFGVSMKQWYANNDTAAYRYGYQSMEKVDEWQGAGNAYDFGARIYNPRLGRWLSVDPQADAFPDMSPYTGMGNNPIDIVDPDGEKIVVKRKTFLRRKPVIKIKVTGVLIDNSSKNLTRTQLKEVRDRIEAGIKAAYTGEGTDVKWKGKAKIRVGNRGEKSLRKNDHAFRLYDDGKLPDSNNPGGVRPGGVIGHAPRGERVVELNTNLISTPEKDRVSMERTSAHELGHSGGMHQEGGVFVGHPNPSTRPDNLMHQSVNPKAGFNLDQDQILQMEKDYKDKKLNKGRQEIE